MEGERKHSAVSEDLRGIEADETTAREAEAAVLYFSIAASIIAIVGVTFVVDLVTQIAQLLSAVSLIWLLSSVYFLYRAEHLSSEEERFLSERIILGFAMAAAVLAVAAVSIPGFVNSLLAKAFMALALAWLIGASLFLYRSMRSLEAAQATRAKYELASASLVYVDSERERPKLFVSTRYVLSGRPDAVLLEGDVHIPVEVKTGRTPRGPLFSHILQIAAYCLLMEEEYGKAPPHGVIRYGDGSHDIEYNEDLKRLVLQKMAEMRSCLAQGAAHRNHNRPGKCVQCSRRSVCPERLA